MLIFSYSKGKQKKREKMKREKKVLSDISVALASVISF